MGDVIPIVQPLDEQRIIDAIREITDETTEAIVVVTVSPAFVGMRSFGPAEKCIDGLRAVLPHDASQE